MLDSAFALCRQATAMLYNHYRLVQNIQFDEQFLEFLSVFQLRQRERFRTKFSILPYVGWIDRWEAFQGFNLLPQPGQFYFALRSSIKPDLVPSAYTFSHYPRGKL